MTQIALAIDTSTEIASVAVLHGDDVLAEQETADAQRHDHVLLPRIQSVLSASGKSLSDLTLLAVGIGPGAFGGLRVGLATIKGLGLATHVPCIGVSSLHALGCAAPEDARLIVTLVDAHRGELFAALYVRQEEHLVEQVAPFNGTPEHVAAVLKQHCTVTPHVVGHGLAAHHDTLLSVWPALQLDAHGATVFPRARHIAKLAAERLRSGDPGNAETLLPIYIRESDAKLPAQPLLLMPEPKE